MCEFEDPPAPLPRLGVVNKWIIVYDDGKTPNIYTKIVEADMMDRALVESGIPMGRIWACALNCHLGAAAASLLHGMELGVIESKAKNGLLTAEELDDLSLDSIRDYFSRMGGKELADLLRSSAMDYKSINVTAKAEALAKLLDGINAPLQAVF